MNIFRISLQWKQAKEILKFTFDIDTYGNKERTVCFSSEKHLLINKIEEAGKTYELKRFKRSDTNDILITDYTSGKEVEPQFPKSDMQAEFFTIATILNEKAKMASLMWKIWFTA